MKKHIINAGTGIIFATFFIWLTFRNQSFDEITDLLKQAKMGWIYTGLVFLIAVFFFRALRWKLLLSNSDEKVGFGDVSYSLLLGFFINSFTPKLGEVVRCTSLRSSSGVEVSRSLGTVISERIYDLLVLVGGILVITLVELGRLGELIAGAFRSLGQYLSGNIVRIMIFAVAALLLLWVIWQLAGRLGFRDKARSFFRNVYDTARNTFRIRNAGAFTLQTVMVWLLMVVMNFCCLMALPSTEGLSFWFAVVALFVGSIGWAIPSPGGIGTSHFFVLQLFVLFNLSRSAGIAYGILVNGVTVIFTVLGGLLAILIVNVIRLIKRRSLSV